jgi:hypothetical protein
MSKIDQPKVGVPVDKTVNTYEIANHAELQGVVENEYNCRLVRER